MCHMLLKMIIMIFVICFSKSGKFKHKFGRQKGKKVNF